MRLQLEEVLVHVAEDADGRAARGQQRVYLEAWVLKSGLGTQKWPGYSKEAWVLKSGLGTQKRPGYSKVAWVLKRGLGTQTMAP